VTIFRCDGHEFTTAYVTFPRDSLHQKLLKFAQFSTELVEKLKAALLVAVNRK